MTDNPLWVREVRARMRGGKAYVVLLVYTLLLTLLSGIVYLQWLDSQQVSGSRFTSQAAFEAGQLLYRTLFVTQAILVALITPSITAGAITLEREQRTLEMVAITRLRPAQIISGKLAGAVAFVALLLTSSLPLVSLAFLLGGVSPGELFFTYLVLLVSATLFGAIGLLCSTVVRSTAAATALAHGAVGIFFVVSLSTGLGATGLMPFRSLNAIGAVFHSTSGEQFFRATLPSWLIAVTLLGLLAALVANVAMTRLEHYDEPRPIPIRLLATTLWALFFLLLIGNLYSTATGTALSSQGQLKIIGALASTLLAALLVLLPLFATGRAADLTRGRYLLGMLPHRLLAGDLPSGVPLLGLWLLVPFVWIVLGSVVIGQAASLPLFDALLPALFLTVAVVAGYTALGHCLSVWLPSRWSAMALCYALILAGTLLPLLSAIYGWRAPLAPSDNAPRLLWQALYLTPFLGIYELVSADVNAFWSELPPMLLGRTHFWRVTTVVHFLAATGLVVATLAGLGRKPAPGAAS